MNRRSFLTQAALLPLSMGLASLTSLPGRLAAAPAANPRKLSRKYARGAGFQAALKKTDAEWKEILGNERFQILFKEATERSGSSPLDREKREGTFVCAACYLPLFDASMKFDSGTGWPSFTDTLPERLETKTDYKLILPRTEYHCARCGGHQGHLFSDGPQPTGNRYCNNGLALLFVSAKETLPALRN